MHQLTAIAQILAASSQTRQLTYSCARQRRLRVCTQPEAAGRTGSTHHAHAPASSAGVAGSEVQARRGAGQGRREAARAVRRSSARSGGEAARGRHRLLDPWLLEPSPAPGYSTVMANHAHEHVAITITTPCRGRARRRPAWSTSACPAGIVQTRTALSRQRRSLLFGSRSADRRRYLWSSPEA